MKVQKLIIFDCDGVLVDSGTLYDNQIRDLLAEYGYHLTEVDEAHISGKLVNDIQAYAKEIFGAHIPNNRWEDLLRQESSMFKNTTELKPLMTGTLQRLHAQKIAKCVASNSPINSLRLKLQHTAQKHFFLDEHIFSADHVTCGKPAPDLFLHAAKQMVFDPKDCLIIEDSSTGIEAALAAKIPVIGFLGGSHARHDAYVEKIKAYNIPLAYSEADVYTCIQKHGALHEL